MAGPEENGQPQPQVRSMATIDAAMNFAATATAWKIEASGPGSGPQPVRVIVATESNFACYFLSPDDADDLASKLHEAAGAARSGLLIAKDLPRPEDGSQR
jgi:hypothetical protein